MAQKPSRKRFKTTGVRLEEPVIEYLDDLAAREERNRSYFINRIVREYAKQNGTPLPAADEEPRTAIR
jgi:metal-responsive CopG/Arc/MetJ family transcriptional regulator